MALKDFEKKFFSCFVEGIEKSLKHNDVRFV